MTDAASPSVPPSVPHVPIQIAGHYVRDISFENVTPPFLRKGALSGQPTMEVNLNLDARPASDVADNAFEVVLKLQVTARRDDITLFIAEIEYGTVALLADVPEEFQTPLLFIEVPKLMFPFARAILADLTAQSGYPPLLLTPVDFYGMYVSRFGQNGQGNGAAQQQPQKAAG